MQHVVYQFCSVSAICQSVQQHTVDIKIGGFCKNSGNNRKTTKSHLKSIRTYGSFGTDFVNCPKLLQE